MFYLIATGNKFDQNPNKVTIDSYTVVIERLHLDVSGQIIVDVKYALENIWKRKYIFCWRLIVIKVISINKLKLKLYKNHMNSNDYCCHISTTYVIFSSSPFESNTLYLRNILCCEVNLRIFVTRELKGEGQLAQYWLE